MRNILRSASLSAGLLVVLSGFSPAFAHHESDTLPLFPRDAADACVDGSQQIRVTVKDAQHKGLVKVELYRPDDKFLRDETRKARVAASDIPFRVCFDIAEPGTYAIVGYNDLDADRKLDKKLFKPKEPFGAVNSDKLKNRKKRPKFKQVSFEVGPQGADVDLILVDP